MELSLLLFLLTMQYGVYCVAVMCYKRGFAPPYVHVLSEYTRKTRGTQCTNVNMHAHAQSKAKFIAKQSQVSRESRGTWNSTSLIE